MATKAFYKVVLETLSDGVVTTTATRYSEAFDPASASCDQVTAQFTGLTSAQLKAKFDTLQASAPTTGTVSPRDCTTTTNPPGWVTDLQWKHNGTTLTVQAAGEVATIAFNTVPTSTFSTTNPDNVPLQNGVDYLPGQVDNGVYKKQWQINKAPGAFALTLKNASGESFTKSFTASQSNTFTALVGTAVNPTTNPENPPPQTGSTANLPSWESFHYQPITTNTEWTEFDSRTDRFGKQVGEQASLELGGITVRVRKRHGGAPTHVSRPGGSNIINIHDLGTMNGYALYRGGLISPNPSAVINTQWAQPPSGGVGNDPIQHGDVYDNPSPILAYGRNATTIYTKTAMKNWAVQNETTDAVMEQWVVADPSADYVVHVYTKVSYNRTDDKTFYEFEAQEYPCVYTQASYRRLRYIDANGNLSQMENQPEQADLGIRKPWVALENVYDSSKAIGLWAPGMYLSTQWQKSVDDGADEFSNGAGYTANRAFLHAHWNDVWYGHHAFIVGDANKIKTWAEAQPDPRNKISWKFNQRNGIGHFGFKNGVTSGFPTPDTGVEITKTTSQNEFYIKWPYMAVPAAGISKLYMYYKATGPSTSRVLRFQKAGQQEIDAQQANQEVTFQTINDNTWRTAEINVGANGGWNNTISLLKLLDANQPEGAKLTISWFNTSNADPEPAS